MTDEIERAVGHIAHVSLRRLPVLAMIEDAVKPFLPAGADERLRAAVEADAREAFVRLQQRVDVLEGLLGKDGHRLDDLGAKRTVAVAQEVAKGVAEAYGEPKIDAMLNAGARQFDPRMGPQEIRKYWLDRVTQLLDIEVRVLLLLKEHQPIMYFEEADRMLWGEQRQAADLPDEDRVALGTVLNQLVSRGDLVSTTSTTGSVDQETVFSVMLSGQGRAVVRFIEPIAPQE